MEVQWGKMRERIARKYNIKFQHKTHDCRATYGTYLLASLLEIDSVGASEAMKTVMLRMGHEQERTTWEYLSWIKEREIRQQVMCMLDKIMEESWRDNGKNY
jgi:integrase